MESPEAVEPSVGSGKVGDAQSACNVTRFPLEHGARHAYVSSPLLVVPIPDALIRLLVAGASGASFPRTDVWIRFRLLLIPFLQQRSKHQSITQHNANVLIKIDIRATGLPHRAKLQSANTQIQNSGRKKKREAN